MSAVCWALLLGCGFGGADPAASPPPAPPEVEVPPPHQGPALVDADTAGLPDIVLVSIDTLRPDHLGAYGYERPTSPFLDRLAARGVRFAHARSPSPWTLPAHSTLLTGQLPTTHGVVEDTLRLPPSLPVLPELLHARGYATGAAVTTIFVSSRYGFERGFHHFQDFGILQKRQNLRHRFDMRAVNDDLMTYVRSVPKERPLFLFLHTYDVHYPYTPPPPYDTLFDRAPRPDDELYRSYSHYQEHPLDDAQLAHKVAQYDESIRWVDDQLAALAGALEAAGRQPRWIVTSDHGEEFGERGSWGHAHTLYAEQLRVPLLVSGPGVPAGVVVDEAVGLQDVAPTIAAWAGVADGLLAPDGIDLSPHLDGSTPPPARPFLAETSRHRTARLSLYEGGRRLEWDVWSDRLEVYADPEERTDLGPDPALQRRLLQVFGTAWRANEDGEVRINRGRILGMKLPHRMTVLAGQRFRTYPLDAPLRLKTVAGVSGPVYSHLPDTTPFEWLGGAPPVHEDLDDDTRAALEALGYMQEE